MQCACSVEYSSTCFDKRCQNLRVYTVLSRGPQRDGNPVQGGEEIQEIQLKIANEKLYISVGTELRRRRVT